MDNVIFIPRSISPQGTAYLTDRGFSVREGSALDEETMCREVRGCRGILVRTARITRKVMEAEPELRIVARNGTGLDIIDVEAATQLGIQVTNTPQANGQSVAELTLGGMLETARKLRPLEASARRGDFFYKNRCQGRELWGKVLGLVGFGDIGQRVARMAALGFEMNVLVYEGHLQGRQLPDYVTPVPWEELFCSADFLSLHIPLRPENRELVGEREFALMKPDAIFLNTARGGVVCEQALVDALERGQIAGAFLDVLSEEPFPADHPLLHMEQVVVTPHCGSNTREALDRSGLHAAMEIDRFFRGQPLRWPVNQVPRREK